MYLVPLYNNKYLYIFILHVFAPVFDLFSRTIVASLPMKRDQFDEK